MRDSLIKSMLAIEFKNNMKPEIFKPTMLSRITEIQDYIKLVHDNVDFSLNIEEFEIDVKDANAKTALQMHKIDEELNSTFSMLYNLLYYEHYGKNFFKNLISSIEKLPAHMLYSLLEDFKKHINNIPFDF